MSNSKGYRENITYELDRIENEIFKMRITLNQAVLHLHEVENQEYVLIQSQKMDELINEYIKLKYK